MTDFEEFVTLLLKHPEAVHKLQEIARSGALQSASVATHCDTI